MSKLIPDWRYKDLQCIAESIITRAGYCLAGRVAAIAERKFLKVHSHICFLIDPTLDIGEAEIEPIEKLRKLVGGSSELEYYKIIIRFNGDASTKKNWEETTKGLLRAIGEIIFFSRAKKLPEDANLKRELGEMKTDQDRKQFLDNFAKRIINQKPTGYQSIRPRFSLARLREIIEKDPQMQRHVEHLIPHLQKLLHNYLGADAFMNYEA